MLSLLELRHHSAFPALAHQSPGSCVFVASGFSALQTDLDWITPQAFLVLYLEDGRLWDFLAYITTCTNSHWNVLLYVSMKCILYVCMSSVICIYISYVYVCMLLLLSRFSRVQLCVQPHRQQPTRLLCPWDSPGKNTGAGCYFLLQCIKVKSQSEVAQSCLTPSDPTDCSPPGSSIRGIFQARVLEWGAIAFSNICVCVYIYIYIYTYPVASVSLKNPD